MKEGLDKLLIVNEWFTRGLWLSEIKDDTRLIGASLKVQPTGFLLVLKGMAPGGSVVAFVGAPTLQGIMRKTTQGLNGNSIRWRADQFALDRK